MGIHFRIRRTDNGFSQIEASVVNPKGWDPAVGRRGFIARVLEAGKIC
jgi:hypothetical protein